MNIKPNEMYIICKVQGKKKTRAIFFTMPDSPDTVGSAPGSPDREQSPADVEGRSPLYQSLMAALDMPTTAKREWLETVADFKTTHERSIYRLIMMVPSILSTRMATSCQSAFRPFLTSMANMPDSDRTST